MAIALGERQEHVLDAIVREYIRTAEPVGSVAVVEKYRIDASPATIRNDMAELESLGFIRQPHTSAGRVPTEAAYRYYVKHFIREKPVPRREAEELRAVWALHEAWRDLAKLTAKATAAFTTESVFMAFGRNDVYYTGLSNLFAQPEFAETERVVSMSVVIDQLDDVVAGVFEAARENVDVLVGAENPFGSTTSVIVTRCDLGNSEHILFGLLGPTRMDYDLNVARVKYVREGLENI